MHNSCPGVSSADKSQRLHLLFIENSSNDESNKQLSASPAPSPLLLLFVFWCGFKQCSLAKIK